MINDNMEKSPKNLENNLNMNVNLGFNPKSLCLEIEAADKIISFDNSRF